MERLKRKRLIQKEEIQDELWNLSLPYLVHEQKKTTDTANDWGRRKPLYSKADLITNVRPLALPWVEREGQLMAMFHCTT